MCGPSSKHAVTDADGEALHPNQTKRWADIEDDFEDEESPSTSKPCRQPSFKRSLATDGKEQPLAAPKSWAAIAAAAATADDAWTEVTRKPKASRPSPAGVARSGCPDPSSATSSGIASQGRRGAPNAASQRDQPTARKQKVNDTSARGDRTRGDAVAVHSSRKSSSANETTPAAPASSARKNSAGNSNSKKVVLKTKDGQARVAMDSSRLSW